MEPKVTIKIPRELYRKLKKMTDGTGFSSVSEFIVFVTRSVASTGDLTEHDQLTNDEVRAIRERLKRLGYMKEDE